MTSIMSPATLTFFNFIVGITVFVLSVVIESIARALIHARCASSSFAARVLAHVGYV